MTSLKNLLSLLTYRLKAVRWSVSRMAAWQRIKLQNVAEILPFTATATARTMNEGAAVLNNASRAQRACA